MKYFSLNEYGSPDNLTLQEKELAPPGPGEVQIRHSYISVNQTDILYRKGVYPAEIPGIIGTSAIGYIEDIGKNVEGYTIGDRVIYANGALGAYCDVRNIDNKFLFNAPPQNEDFVVAGYFDKIFAAHYLMRRTFKVMKDDIILIRGAGGAVGHVMCQLGKKIGATIIALVTSKEGGNFAKKNGADYVIFEDSETEDKIMEITKGRGAKISYDMVGGENAKILFCLSGFFGLIVFAGDVIGTLESIELKTINERGLFITKPDLNIYKKNRYELILTANEVFEILNKKIIIPKDILEYDFIQIPQAHKDIEERKYRGCIVAKV